MIQKNMWMHVKLGKAHTIDPENDSSPVCRTKSKPRKHGVCEVFCCVKIHFVHCLSITLISRYFSYLLCSSCWSSSLCRSDQSDRPHAFFEIETPMDAVALMMVNMGGSEK